MTAFSLAIVGAGASGLYAAQAALRAEEIAQIDVIERLPCPHGLIRYGVAPDHPRTRAVAKGFNAIFDDPRVRFLGNVTLGRDLSRQELVANYDAVVYATGASEDRELGVPGEDLPGSVGAMEIVSWYTGHPLAAASIDLSATTAAVVVGAGNVAVDIARILTKPSLELRQTDIPQHVLDALASSTISDVHVLARRGPEHAKFTPVELRELVEQENVDVLVHGAQESPPDPTALPAPVRSNLRLLELARSTSPGPGRRRVHLHFWTAVTRVNGNESVESVTVATSVPGAGALPSTSGDARIETRLLVRAIGTRAAPIDGLPYDSKTGTVPNREGRILDACGTTIPREYVSGWLKRGAQGVIGTNRRDSTETIDGVRQDWAQVPTFRSGRPSGIAELLESRGVQVVDWAAWRRIEAHEVLLGASRDATYIKMHNLRELLRVGQGC